MVMGKIRLPFPHCLALVLWLVAACGNSQAQAPKTVTSKTRSSHEAVSRTKMRVPSDDVVALIWL